MERWNGLSYGSERSRFSRVAMNNSARPTDRLDAELTQPRAPSSFGLVYMKLHRR
jgi:hypothetical protein